MKGWKRQVHVEKEEEGTSPRDYSNAALKKEEREDNTWESLHCEI